MQPRKMTAMRTFTRQSFLALLCLSVVVWSIAPVVSHASEWAEAAYEYPDNASEHGHPHGMLEALLWVLHGHSHGAGDHDHSQAMPVVARADSAMRYRDSLQSRPVTARSTQIFRIERPPRA